MLSPMCLLLPRWRCRNRMEKIDRMACSRLKRLRTFVPRGGSLAAMALILGLVLGAIWHQLWLFPFPQLSQLRHRPSKEWEWDFLPSDQAAYYMRDSMAGHIHKPHVILEFAW